MKLVKFRNNVKQEIDNFFYWYIRNRSKDKKNWPLDLDEGEWKEQLYAYLNSYKDNEPILCDTCKNKPDDCGYARYIIEKELADKDCPGHILRK